MHLNIIKKQIYNNFKNIRIKYNNKQKFYRTLIIKIY